MSEVESFRGVQDTGNPVLDSTVNYLMSKDQTPIEFAENVHAMFLKLAELEPGGLKVRSAGGAVKSVTKLSR